MEANNNQKMREALEEAKRVLQYLYKPELSPHDCDNRRISNAVTIINAALSEPPRNCDVGSVKEQYHRFCICCTKHKMPCKRSYTFGCAECYAKWSRMPYEEGESNEQK